MFHSLRQKTWGTAPSIDFEFNGINYTTSREERSRLFVRPIEAPKEELFSNANHSSKKYQNLFVATRPASLSPNSVAATMYVIVEGNDLFYSVEQVYDPGWAYQLSLTTDNSGKNFAEHSLKPLSMMLYAIIFLLGGFIFAIFDHWITKKIIQNR